MKVAGPKPNGERLKGADSALAMMAVLEVFSGEQPLWASKSSVEGGTGVPLPDIKDGTSLTYTAPDKTKLIISRHGSEYRVQRDDMIKAPKVVKPALTLVRS
jgi:hypothetical protein